jgi:hypothetical protein
MAKVQSTGVPIPRKTQGPKGPKSAKGSLGVGTNKPKGKTTVASGAAYKPAVGAAAHTPPADGLDKRNSGPGDKGKKVATKPGSGIYAK